MKPISTILWSIVGAAIVSSAGTLHAQPNGNGDKPTMTTRTEDPDPENAELRRQLDSIGFEYSADIEGGYTILLRFESRRSQLVHVVTERSVFYERDVFNVWSRVHSGADMPSDSAMRRLLVANSSMAFGSFSIIPGNVGVDAVIFGGSLPASRDHYPLRRALMHVASMADALEKELFKNDVN